MSPVDSFCSLKDQVKRAFCMLDKDLRRRCGSSKVLFSAVWLDLGFLRNIQKIRLASKFESPFCGQKHIRVSLLQARTSAYQPRRPRDIRPGLEPRTIKSLPGS